MAKKKNKIEDFITVNKNDLLSALKKIKPGISTKDLIQEYACVYLSDKDVSSFSERMIVSYPFEFPKPLNCLVDYTILVSILDKINSVDVNLSLTENELIIFTDSIKSGIALIEGFHPLIDLPYDWFEFPEDFMSGLEFCSFSVSKDMTIPS